MTPISRRDVLAGLAASSAASIVKARSEQRQSTAASNAVLLRVMNAVNTQMHYSAISERRRRCYCGLPMES